MGNHESVIECEKCSRWGCPECTQLPRDIHKALGKWGNLHWFYTACEVEVKHFCSLTDPDKYPEQEANTESERRITRLEGTMSRLEDKMQELIVQNTTVVKSYAEVIGKNVNTSGQGNSQDEMRILSTERQTVKILDEYADRERRKVNIIIHNLPESTKDKLQDRNEDDIK